MDMVGGRNRMLIGPRMHACNACSALLCMTRADEVGVREIFGSPDPGALLPAACQTCCCSHEPVSGSTSVIAVSAKRGSTHQTNFFPNHHCSKISYENPCQPPCQHMHASWRPLAPLPKPAMRLFCFRLTASNFRCVISPVPFDVSLFPFFSLLSQRRSYHGCFKPRMVPGPQEPRLGQVPDPGDLWLCPQRQR